MSLRMTNKADNLGGLTTPVAMLAFLSRHGLGIEVYQGFKKPLKLFKKRFKAFLMRG